MGLYIHHIYSKLCYPVYIVLFFSSLKKKIWAVSKESSGLWSEHVDAVYTSLYIYFTNVVYATV